MKVSYDKDTDTLSIILRPGKVAESDEIRDGLIFDYDKSGCVLSINIRLFYEDAVKFLRQV